MGKSLAEAKSAMTWKKTLRCTSKGTKIRSSSLIGRTQPRSCMYVLKALKSLGSPPMLMQFVLLLYCQSFDLSQSIKQVEFFAGKHECTKAAWRAGKTAIAFERDLIPMLGYLTEQGYVIGTRLILKTQPAASLCPMAPVCSSWLNINAGTSGRSWAFPMGNWRIHSYVHEANVMVSRVALHCILMSALGIPFFVEQPKGSMMEAHPRFKWIIKLLGLFRVYIAMWRFGHKSCKGSWLYSPFPWLKDLNRYSTSTEYVRDKSYEMTVQYVDKHGVKRYKGGRHLKSSQAYTRAFADACQQVAELHANDLRTWAHERQQKALLTKISRDDLLALRHASPKDMWKDAQLSDVFAELLRGT